jgi:hypothetical protein
MVIERTADSINISLNPFEKLLKSNPTRIIALKHPVNPKDTKLP